MHPHPWLDLVFDHIPVVSLDLPVIFRRLTFVFFFKFPAYCHEIWECVPFWILIERFTLGEILKDLISGRQTFLRKLIKSQVRPEAFRRNDLHYTVALGLLYIVQVFNILHRLLKFLLGWVVSLHLLDFVQWRFVATALAPAISLANENAGRRRNVVLLHLLTGRSHRLLGLDQGILDGHFEHSFFFS